MVLEVNDVETLIVAGQEGSIMYCEMYANGVWTECVSPSRHKDFKFSIVWKNRLVAIKACTYHTQHLFVYNPNPMDGELHWSEKTDLPFF